MSVIINTKVIRRVNPVNDAGLTLTILKYARQLEGGNPVATPEPLRINSLGELYEKFGLPAEIEDNGNITNADDIKQAMRELVVLEYLLTQGVNLIVLAAETVGTLAQDDLDKVDNPEDWGYKMILAPYSLQTDTAHDTLLVKHAVGRDVELYLDIDPSLSKTDIVNTKTAIKGDINAALNVAYSGKVSLFINAGEVIGLTSAYTKPYYNNKTINMDEDPTEGTEIPFYGIPLSAAVAVRKARLLHAGQPWFAVAGENENGLLTEFGKLYKRYMIKDKNEIQALDINLVVLKNGVGNVIVAQNTLARVDDSEAEKNNPLIRSHVVTQALYIKEKVKAITESIIYLQHNTKTYDAWQLKVEKILEEMLGADGILRYQALTGPSVMTQDDYNNGIFKGSVSYTPVNVVESAVITLNIIESSDTGVIVEGV